MRIKLTTIGLVSTIMMSFFVSVAWGEVSDPRWKTFKEVFRLPSSAIITQENHTENPIFQWTLNSNGLFGSGHITVDQETGEVQRYVEYYPSRLPVVMKLEECQEAVEEVITKLWPDKKEKLKLKHKPSRLPAGSGTFGDDIVYSFSYQRFEGSIPVEFDGADINFDASTGRVIDISLRWYRGRFPTATGLISTSKAATLYAEKVPIQLQWKKFPSGQGDLKFNLLPIYNASDGYSVEAVTGELIKPNFAFNLVPYNFNANDHPISYPEFDPARKTDQSEAIKIARSLLKIPDSNQLAATENRWFWGEQGRVTALTFPSADGKREMKVAVDQVTGKITMLYYNEPEYAGKEQFDYESGKKLAGDFCSSLAGEEFSRLNLVTRQSIGDQPSRETHYSYIRYIYGIPYMDNGTYVVLNESTGNLIWYTFIWERNLNIPRLDSILELNQFRSKLAQVTEMDLTYRVTSISGGKEEAAKLIYVPKGSMGASYDAVKGTMVTEAKPNLVGNQYHWAVPDFQFLAKCGIIDTSVAINPDQKITRADFIKMLVLATYLPPKSTSAAVFNDITADSPYARYIANAYEKRIVSGSGGKFYPDRPLTRQEAAVIISLALKSEGRIDSETMKRPDVDFIDNNRIAPWAAQAVKEVAKLGYIQGFRGYFNPTSTITWGQTAALLKQYMNKSEF